MSEQLPRWELARHNNIHLWQHFCGLLRMLCVARAAWAYFEFTPAHQHAWLCR